MSKKVYDIIPPEKTEEVLEEEANTSTHNNSHKSNFWSNFLKISLGLLVILGVVYFFTYRVNIKIWPQTEGVELEEELTVDANLEVLGGKEIPGTGYETDFLEEYEVFPATGTETEDTKAEGVITIHNEYWTENQPLMEGTRFKSSEGLVFKTKERVIVPSREIENGEPAASQLDVEVVAEESGDEYNVKPGKFTIPGLEGGPSEGKVWGESDEAMTGGATGKRVVVTKEDIQKAEKEVKGEILKQGKSLLQKEKDDSFLLGEESQYNVRVQTKEVEAQPGENVEEFGVSLRANVEALTFKKSHLREILISHLLKNAENNELGNLETEKKVYEDSLSFHYQFEDVDWSQGTAKLAVEFEGEVYSDLNQSRLVNKAKGSSRQALEANLEEKDFIRKVQVRFWPFVIGNIPEDGDRIQISLQF